MLIVWSDMHGAIFVLLLHYCGLLELWYGDKWNKTLTAKEWGSRDGLSIKEMKQSMDAKMFLDEYPHWEARELQCPLILQEMFLHPTHSGWKEAEQMICQGCQHGFLHLDPQVDISAIQLLGHQSTREEIWYLYHQVYKLRRLPGSLLCRPEQVHKLMRDVVSFLKKTPMAERGQTAKRM